MAPASTPLVSVILPAYNSEAFVQAALDSALAQTFTDLEVLFVDDASTDGTALVGERAAALDPRVRVIRNERNLGTGGTVNRAVRRARGEWVAQLDHDDRWRPERLERLLAASDDADIVSDDVEIVADAGSDRHGFRSGSLLDQVGLRVTAPRRLGLVEFIRHDPGLVHPLIRREFLLARDLRLDPSAPIDADFELWVRLLAAGARWVQLPDAYYVWRRAPGAQSRRLEQEVEEVALTTPRLLADPAIAADERAKAALRARQRLFRSHLAHARLRAAYDRGGVRALAGLAAAHPTWAALVLRRRLFYARLEWARRRLAA
jgi:succinoglycan biosynthesis protein ExoO